MHNHQLTIMHSDATETPGTCLVGEIAPSTEGMMIIEGEIDLGIVDLLGRDMRTGTALQTEGDDAAAIETTVIGEMTPVIGFIDATRITLTRMRGLDWMMVEIGGQCETSTQSVVMSVSHSSVLIELNLTMLNRLQSLQYLPGIPMSRRKQRDWPN